MPKLILSASFGSLSLLLVSCATVSKGTADYFRVDTVPQGARVTTSVETDASYYRRKTDKDAVPEYYGCSPTPCSVKLNRHSKFVATIAHPNHESAEIYIGSSTKVGSLAVNMTGNVVVPTATGAAIGAVYGTVLAETAAIFFSGITYGLVPVSSIPTSGAAAAVAGPAAVAGAGIGVGMVAVDAASGANKHLFPNPVVLTLSPKGTPSKIDPNVAMFRADQAKKKH